MPASFLPSLLRTVVPLVVTVAAGWPITQQLAITDAQLTIAVSALVGGLYWLIVRALETWRPQFGWLLGYASKPVYVAPAAAKDGVHLVTSAFPLAGRRIQ